VYPERGRSQRPGAPKHCAPPGPQYYHYVFESYALSEKLDLPATASRPELLTAMKYLVATAAYR
jgi:phosphatidylethanolamine-binding protein (PEBP) family uncharacterized protein